MAKILSFPQDSSSWFVCPMMKVPQNTQEGNSWFSNPSASRFPTHSSDLRSKLSLPIHPSHCLKCNCCWPTGNSTEHCGSASPSQSRLDLLPSRPGQPLLARMLPLAGGWQGSWQMLPSQLTPRAACTDSLQVLQPWFPLV